MRTRLFYTTGNRDIIEEEWDKPEPLDGEVEIKAVYTGICRSDVDMYNGQFTALPKYIQGHEGLGIVTRVGKDIKDIREGDFVATRGEPAFADFYNSPRHMIVKIPELSPKYIIEPVACGVNIAHALKFDSKDEILILGTGFLSTVVVELLGKKTDQITVVGRANEDHWKTRRINHLKDIRELGNKKFKSIIDLSDKPEYTNLPIYSERANVVIAAEKHPFTKTTFAQFLWNSVNVSFPSPRNDLFHQHMKTAVDMVMENSLDFGTFWTKKYSRDTEVKQAFEEALDRPQNYSRGYVAW